MNINNQLKHDDDFIKEVSELTEPLLDILGLRDLVMFRWPKHIKTKVEKGIYSDLTDEQTIVLDELISILDIKLPARVEIEKQIDVAFFEKIFGSSYPEEIKKGRASGKSLLLIKKESRKKLLMLVKGLYGIGASKNVYTGENKETIDKAMNDFLNKGFEDLGLLDELLEAEKLEEIALRIACERAEYELRLKSIKTLPIEEQAEIIIIEDGKHSSYKDLPYYLEVRDSIAMHISYLESIEKKYPKILDTEVELCSEIISQLTEAQLQL